MHSLSRRLLLSVFISLIAFFGVTIIVLDATFRIATERSMQVLLDAQIVALIASAEMTPNSGFEPARQLETRLTTPGSGLYAQIQSTEPGDVPWRSPSAAGTFIDFGPPVAPGETRFEYVQAPQEELAIASRGISFEGESGEAHSLTFSVATSLAPYESQHWGFRTQLLGWFFGLTLALVVTLAFLLQWVLKPMRRLEQEIYEVEEGAREALGEGYPRELSGVATNLNTLLAGERNRMARYRDTLGNLAHSLKTPLAVMRSTIAGVSSESAATMQGEIDRMAGIIEHQLKRAASGGALLGQAPVEVEQIAEDLRAALLKVHQRKDFVFRLRVADSAQFLGDRGDLMELLGNVFENACKWCVSQVSVQISVDDLADAKHRLSIQVDDDGPGISEQDRARVLQRGVRADEKVPGHGLGLAMVRDTVDLYGGRLSILSSGLGGARFVIALPGRRGAAPSADGKGAKKP